MHAIERQIREAVEKLADNSPESRSQIYLMARQAIQKMPQDQSTDAMQVLFEAVKSIEKEFVIKEFDEQAVSDATADGPAKKTQRKNKVSVPWGGILATVTVVLIISGSSYLLYTQF